MRNSEDGDAVVVGAEGEDVLPGVAGVGGEMGGVSGLDGAVEDVGLLVELLHELFHLLCLIFHHRSKCCDCSCLKPERADYA